MSKTRKNKGSSRKLDATTSNTSTTLKITPTSSTDYATACDTTPTGNHSDAPPPSATVSTTTLTTTPATTDDSSSDRAHCADAAPAIDDTDPVNGLIGKLLVGAYMVKKEIERSSCRRVFEGTDIRNESKVAIVILPVPAPQTDGKRSSTRQTFSANSKSASNKTRPTRNRNQSHKDRNESALCQLEAETGIKIRAYEREERFCYCVIALESLDEFENPQPKRATTPVDAANNATQVQKLLAASTMLCVLLFGGLSLAFVFQILPGFESGRVVHQKPVNIPIQAAFEAVSVPLTNDSDLNPTNDFIAFDPLFVDGFSTTGRVDMAGINRVIAQSVIVSLNARDINTSSAVFHAQSVASAAKGVARSLRSELVNSSSKFTTVFPPGSDHEPCFVGEAQSTNVFFPNNLTSAMSVSYPSSLKSQSPGGKRRNGDEYMAGYSKIRVPIGDTTIDIAGVPVFPLRSNEPQTLDDIKASQNEDPISSDYLPPNSILVGDKTTKYSDIVACSVFGSADKDYAACIPRGYIRITNGRQERDYDSDAYNCPVNDSRDDSFVGDWQSSNGLPWIGELRWNKQVFRSPPSNPYYVDYDAMERKGDTKSPESPLAFLNRIGEGNATGEEFLLQSVTARMKQVDPSITLADVKVALNQGMLRYGGEPLYLYSPAPGAKLQCDLGYPYMSKTIPNDGLNSAVEVACETVFNLDVKEPNQRLLSGVRRAIFTPATGWRNLLGDITFEYETKNSGTFSRP